MNTIWKSMFTGQVGGGRGGLLVDQQNPFKSLQLVNAQGSVLDTLNPTSTTRGESGFKYVASKPGSAYGQNVFLKFSNDGSNYGYLKLGDAGRGWGGDLDYSNLSSYGSFDKAASLNPYEHSSSGGGNVANGYNPSVINGYGVAPAYVGDLFPKPTNAKAAQLKQTDPLAFAQQYGEANNAQYLKNFSQSQGLALDTLQTELQGLQGYAPAAAALARSETSADNAFNQAQRTDQVNSVMPNAAKDLEAQRQRANAYANGGLPSGMDANALGINLAASAADSARAGGFGASSSAARKEAGLLSVQQQLQLGQYGESLLGQNLSATQALQMAPTEYSNAGSKINIMPSLSASQLTGSYLQDINQNTMISPTNALQTVVQQNEFQAGNEQQANLTNAANANNFALSKFQYQVGYAGAVAGAAQTGLNTQTQLDLTHQYWDIMQKYADKAQSAQEISSILGGMGSIIGGLGGVSGIGNIVSGIGKGISGIFGGGTDTSGNSQIPEVQTPDTTIKYPTGTGEGGSQAPGYSLGPDDPYVTPGETTTPVEVPSSGGSSIPDFQEPSTNFNFDPSGGGPQLESYQMSPRLAQTAGSISSDIGLKMNTQGAQGALDASMINASHAVLNQAGVSLDPKTGLVMSGVSLSGQTTYSEPHMLTNNDHTLGQQAMASTSQIVSPMFAAGNGLPAEDFHSAVSQVGETSADANLINKLDTHSQNGDIKGFVGTATNAFGTNTKPAQIDAHALASNWSNMSRGQKSLGLAAMGIKNATTADGKPLLQSNIREAKLAPTGELASPKLPLGQAIALAKSGVNVPPLAQNWDDISNISKALMGKTSVIDNAQTAMQLGLLGKGTNGAQITTSPEAIQSAGFQTASHLGVGAIVSTTKGAKPPSGFKVVDSKPGITVALPAGLEQSYSGLGGAQQTSYTRMGTGQTISAGGSALSTVGNATNYVSNFNNLDTGHKVVGGAGVVNSGVNTANQFGAFGNTTNAAGDVVSNSNIGTGQIVGGVGATLGAANLAMNWNNMNDLQKGTGVLGTGSSAAQAAGYSGAGYVAGPVGMAMGAYQVSQGWGEGGGKGAMNGAIGGAAICAGAYGLASAAGLAAGVATIPVAGWVAAGVIMATAILGDTIHTGKPESQNQRDDFRAGLQKNGLVDSSYNVTLADGSKYNIGTDGQKGSHSASNPSMLAKDAQGRSIGDAKGNLEAYDVDYTNNLDYASSMGSKSLVTLLAGGSNSRAVNQIGGQLANAALGKVGFNKEMTADNFNSVMANQRAMYAKSGITSKDAAYQLANKAYSEGRISATDLVVTQQGINMVFDPSDKAFDTANKLMSGRNQGVQTASSTAPSTGTVQKPGKDISPVTSPTANAITGQETSPGAKPISIPNEVPYSVTPRTASKSNNFSGFNTAVNQATRARPLAESSKVSPLILDKAQARARNQSTLAGAMQNG